MASPANCKPSPTVKMRSLRSLFREEINSTHNSKVRTTEPKLRSLLTSVIQRPNVGAPEVNHEGNEHRNDGNHAQKGPNARAAQSLRHCAFDERNNYTE